jgi:putative photosynthetic complex assembly protein
MMSPSANQIFTTKAFKFIFVGLATVVLVIGSLRLAGFRPPPSLPNEPALQSRELAVEDAAEGTVIVRDAKTGEHITTYRRGEGSFFRATLRTLVNDRRHKGLAAEGNFRLENHSGNQLFLIDETSGKTLSMNAFGPSNTAVFAALISNQKEGEGL